VSAEPLTEADALDFFATLYRGKHHIPSKVRKDGGAVFSVSHFGGMATYDYDELTRLVFLAHERGIRAWIHAGQPRHLRIFIQRRRPGAHSLSEHHATLDEAVEKFRTNDESSWVLHIRDRAP
jgi:hypothetical protein